MSVDAYGYSIASSYLVPPGEPEESMENGMFNPGDFFNYLSPSAWINDIIERASGIDIFGYATETLTGEWDALYKFGTALQSLAPCLQQIGVNVQQGAEEMDHGWSGNGADSAFAYYTNLAAAISRKQDVLMEASNSYKEAAKGAWELSTQIGNLLQAAIDDAIIAGLAGAFGTATVETGVGPLAGYAYAAYQATQIATKINLASKIINTAITVIMGIFGAGVTFFDRGADLSEIPLPATSFALPET